MEKVSAADADVILSDGARKQRAQLAAFLPVVKMKLDDAKAKNELPTFVFDAVDGLMKSFEAWGALEAELVDEQRKAKSA